MNDILIDVAINIAVMIVGTIITAFVSAAKTIKNNRLRKVATEIAKTVETIYRDCTSEEKLEAFKDLCREKKIDANKAVKYLEKEIIPTSKSINAMPPRDDTSTSTETEGFD